MGRREGKQADSADTCRTSQSHCRCRLKIKSCLLRAFADRFDLIPSYSNLLQRYYLKATLGSLQLETGRKRSGQLYKPERFSAGTSRGLAATNRSGLEEHSTSQQLGFFYRRTLTQYTRAVLLVFRSSFCMKATFTVRLSHS